MEPRRTDPRFERRVDVAVVAGDATYLGGTRNLSLGGLCVLVDAPLTFGQKVQLKISLPGQKDPVIVDGEVRWAEGAAGGERAFGIHFLGLRARDVYALNRFFQSLGPGTAK